MSLMDTGDYVKLCMDMKAAGLERSIDFSLPKTEEEIAQERQEIEEAKRILSLSIDSEEFKQKLQDSGLTFEQFLTKYSAVAQAQISPFHVETFAPIKSMQFVENAYINAAIRGDKLEAQLRMEKRQYQNKLHRAIFFVIAFLGIFLFVAAPFYGDSQYADGYDKGYKEGSNTGYSDGYNEGYRGGKRAGTVSGEDTGYSKGYDEGYTQGYYVGFSDAAGVTADPVYITLSGTKYHRAGCSYLNDSAVMTSRSAAIADGYTACSRCNP